MVPKRTRASCDVKDPDREADPMDRRRLLAAALAPLAGIVGHGLGASVAWQAALTRPDRFRAVAALSVPFRPRGKVPPTSLMPRTENAQFYQLYFQEPGPAEAELGRDPRATIRNM